MLKIMEFVNEVLRNFKKEFLIFFYFFEEYVGIYENLGYGFVKF